MIISIVVIVPQVDVLPMLVADRICHGEVLIEPQTYPIGSFENKPTNNIFPSDLYGTVLIAVFGSSDKDEAEADSQEEAQTDDDLENKLHSQDVTDALISLGLVSLFLDSSAIDFVRTTTIFIYCYFIFNFQESQINKMIQSTAQWLLRRASAEELLCEVLDAVVAKCVYTLSQFLADLFK